MSSSSDESWCTSGKRSSQSCELSASSMKPPTPSANGSMV
eukprot:CAMPEP_0194767402 /NCGR_PEP_ID=MMETSP0323_2-20130528/35718_1 /TAXON_ID=2866 ORGANISM="Crypthecodinium cohnii, Strain Seligo" /NCGR_SAMPLE_ID=MMETSP0323_2 /ASSEMBLY_ACC=CAM_ASM_000346 /LENGTH=39 /DNA_ID= /DNA_START= /DNA_END= /DNA_ORIENTATION=